MKTTILVTGVAGFIGFHMTKRLLKEGFLVIGIDNMNRYYDVKLKEDRLKQLDNKNFVFYRESIENYEVLNSIFLKYNPTFVINLAAQAGVKYSTENPKAYIDSNIVGFANILECCRIYKVKKLLFASSSSVYGSNNKSPFSESDQVDNPLTLYAATKKSNELMAHTYSHLYNLQTIGLRFFTVYGPWGRPDMSLFKFTKAMLDGDTINVNNFGKSFRDFTYIDDIVESIYRLINYTVVGEDNNRIYTEALYKVFNIGSNKPIELIEYISIIENILNIEAKKEFLPLPDYDVPHTFADISELQKAINFKPITDIEYGIASFVSWYLKYYDITKEKELQKPLNLASN